MLLLLTIIFLTILRPSDENHRFILWFIIIHILQFLFFVYIHNIWLMSSVYENLFMFLQHCLTHQSFYCCFCYYRKMHPLTHFKTIPKYEMFPHAVSEACKTRPNWIGPLGEQTMFFPVAQNWTFLRKGCNSSQNYPRESKQTGARHAITTSKGTRQADVTSFYTKAMIGPIILSKKTPYLLQWLPSYLVKSTC